ncbi:MAG TPA: sugar transferase [Thermoanaerobaculia bacterium]|jgi:lipopolysaccharide/colanic/teichoic acid biosynthesis glycosyltransferase|nr:sugar transferase [Thermoanaerobaculia bacterium]
MKRAFDVAVSLLALVVLSPFLALIAIAVKITSSGPVFHRGERIGRGGAPFRILKFRTMRINASGPGITRGGDERVTPLGRILRRSKLDELPQLVNVLRGEMSIVGPRPEAPEYVRLYTEEERRVLTVRPGLTSPASLRYRHEESLLGGDDWHDRYVNEIMRDKLRDDLTYIDTRTFLGDLRLIARTFGSLFRP